MVQNDSVAATATATDDPPGHTFELLEGSPLFAGRTVECDLYLPSPAVSRRHAVFLARGGACGVKDLDSANGTFLNGRRITHSMRLKEGDVIQIAAFVLRFTAAEGRNLLLGSGFDTDTPYGAMPAPLEADARPAPRPVAPEDIVPSAPPAPAAPATVAAASDMDLLSAEAEPLMNLEPAMNFEPTMDLAGPEPVMNLEPQMNLPAEPAAPADAEPAPQAPAQAEAQAEPEAAAASVPAASKPAVPSAPARPKIEIPDDEVDDGDGDTDDSAFAIEDETEADAGDPQLALAKKAAEAGLVGEFTPEVDAAPGGEGGGGGGGAGGGAAALPYMADLPERLPENPNAIPISDDFRSAIETRLFLYSFLADMRREREALLAKKPNMAEAVKSELARQDREIDKIPPPDKAEDMAAKRRAKQKDLMDKIKAAKAAGETPPPKPSREMREAEEMAISQWTFCAQSAREALPAAYAEGFKVTRDEPLVADLEKAGVDPVPMLGGGAYYLALEILLEETKFNRTVVRAKLAALPPPDEKGKKKSVRKKAVEEEEEEDDSGPKESYEELTAKDGQLAERTSWINAEIATMEKALIADFWKAYTAVALFYLPEHEQMPFGARAFLRHGAVGFMPWWMPAEVRDHLTADCKDTVHHIVPSRENTDIIYADEYLAAVMNWELTPAMDENLEINERNSPNWKADKALRKLINSRSQSKLLLELTETLDGRVDGLQKEVDGADQELSKLLKGQKNYKQLKSEISMRRQSFKVEMTKLSNLKNKIKNETLATLKEVIEETEQRFESGELPRPTTEFIISRECEAVHKIGRLLANLKERFMPLVLRDNFAVNTDACNDRASIRGEILEMERRDPAIFLETIIPSKKKANRVDLRISPSVVLLPSAGVLAFSWNPRQKPEDGRLGIPTVFIRKRIRERQLTYLLSDFRWDTSKAAAGMDVMTSETIVAAFMTVRWDWRKRSKEGREKGLVYTEQNDRTNWRRVYEAYQQTAYDGGKKLYQRNYDFYERIIGKYFDLPENVVLLKK